MNIHEYQAKALMRKFGILVPEGEIANNAHDAEQIARQLGVALPIFEVAQTFAEITSALGK